MNFISRIVGLCALVVAASSCANPQPVRNELRAPSYPLITIDPYTSAWSPTDQLYDSSVEHWTGKPFPLMGTLRVDGQMYRFMGAEQSILTPIAPAAKDGDWSATYTFTKPSKRWTEPGFNARGWEVGPAPLGTPVYYSAVQTTWNTKDVWVRRQMEVAPEDLEGNRFYLYYSHDDIFELYLNGKQMIATDYVWKEDQCIEIPAEMIAKAGGKVTIAAHCHNRTGGGLVDFGLYKQALDVVSMAQTATQTSVDVQATSTTYDFTCGPVDLRLTFTAPLLTDNLELISRPVNYITYAVSSNDGADHQVEVYFEADVHWAQNTPAQKTTSEVLCDERFNYVKCGTVEQPILKRQGDNVRIDWGYFYMAADKATSTNAVGNGLSLRKAFAEGGEVAATNDGRQMAIARSLGSVGQKEVSDYIMIGYDDILSIQYFGQNMRPYWNRSGQSTIGEQFALAADDYGKLMKKCDKFNRQMMAEAIEAGGREYAEMCALAYRQTIAAHKLIETPKGNLALLSKECFSNGSIGTVDITYPSSPFFLYYNPELAKALMNFIYEYCEGGGWDKDFAPHDVGTYPKANGQTYGGDMPLEESGNMVILAAAVAKIEGNADYALKHWDCLTTWTNYLVENGGDPANQLCTDDFAGHWARNANLSIKAIVGIAAYADLAAMVGKDDVAEKYDQIARTMAAEWQRMARYDDHYALSLESDQDTWSQKYNLVWDKVLGYNVFDSQIALDEVAYYLTKQNIYGLPLDCRRNWTKSDWIMWSATMSPDKATFEEFMRPMHKFFGETTHRVPMTDWYNTDEPTHIYFQNRAVVGGYWMKMLADRLAK
ncbi:MAG: DUF4965 domain-containing protein [Tidjanibacter sp.]|nr:DUF4965 domain-containing protein [Tidjanibacter sp.]